MKLNLHKPILATIIASTVFFTGLANAGPYHAVKLDKVLASQPDKTKSRYDARHPQQTLAFFEIKPGMTVLEALPGGGWYSKLLLPYLGTKGTLIGVDYAIDMYPKFGFFSKEDLKKKETWVNDWTEKAKGWKIDGWEIEEYANIKAYNFGSVSDDLKGKVDAVVFIRALHNLAKFESDGGYLTTALSDAYNALKPGGILGVVQHQIPESADDKGANGSRGYLKKSFLISAMEKSGFEFVASSDINLNPKDKPSAKDIVWRLPPSFATSGKDEKKKAGYKAVGESNRMTLKFRKPMK
ncbi:MAG: methyltransferase [Gammaproteobacteria bacterium]|nr:MAG: methyltransferase [Gammaproteobacteria bacterium]